MFRAILAVFLGICLAVPRACAVDGTQLLEQIDRNMSPESYESYRKIINIEPDGRKKEFTYYTVKKGKDKMAGLFLAPASEKGRTHTAARGQYVALHPQRGQARPDHEPPVGGGRGLQQRRHSEPRLRRGVQRGEGGGVRQRAPSLPQGQDKDRGLRPAEDVGGQDKRACLRRSSA